MEHVRGRYAHRGVAWRHWAGVVDRIEAGDEVVVHGWKVSRWVYVPSWVFVRLKLDGTVTVVEPVRVDVDIVAWEPVA